MFIMHLLWSKNCARRDSERTWIRYLPWRVSILIAGREGRKIRRQSDDECYSRSMCVMLCTLSLSGKVKSMVSLENNTRRENFPEIDHRPKHKSKNCKTSQRKQTFVKNCDAYVHEYQSVVFLFFFSCIVFFWFGDRKKKIWPQKMSWKCFLFYFLKEKVCKIGTIFS